MKFSQFLLWFLLIINSIAIACIYYSNRAEKVDRNQQIPNLVGRWSGENVTLSDLKGYKIWGEKVVHILIVAVLIMAASLVRTKLVPVMLRPGSRQQWDVQHWCVVSIDFLF